MLQVWKIQSLCYSGCEHREVTHCFLSALSTEYRNTTWCGRQIENTAICMVGINSSCLRAHKSPPPNYSTGSRAAPSLSPPWFASCAWLRETRRCWRTKGWQSTSKTLISLGMDEKLHYLCSSDDTEGIVIIRGYFRIYVQPHRNFPVARLCCFTGTWGAAVGYTFSQHSRKHPLFVLCRRQLPPQRDFN